jgi:hypothetical protein
MCRFKLASATPLVAESARMGLRELERRTVATETARALIAGADERSRLPDAIDALLHAPALTPKRFARRLRITPQTGTRCCRNCR